MILYIDTSTSFCRLWIGDNFYQKELGREMARLSLKFIKDSLQAEGLSYEDLSGIVAFAGPGSFTGLRIGVTIANSLADSLEIPIIGALNPDQLPSTESDEWRLIGAQKISQHNDKIVRPFYGRDARITKPRK